LKSIAQQLLHVVGSPVLHSQPGIGMQPDDDVDVDVTLDELVALELLIEPAPPAPPAPLLAPSPPHAPTATKVAPSVTAIAPHVWNFMLNPPRLLGELNRKAGRAGRFFEILFVRPSFLPVFL